MRIRSFTDQDVAAVYAIQAQCPLAGQWKPQDYLELASEPGGSILIAEIEDFNPPLIVGFAAIQLILDEAELRNLVIHPSHRQKGIGRALLERVIQQLQESGAKELYLEVRPSNQPARTFYAAAGFRLEFTRPDYYHDPSEDALEMVLEIPHASGQTAYHRTE